MYLLSGRDGLSFKKRYRLWNPNLGGTLSALTPGRQESK